VVSDEGLLQFGHSKDRDDLPQLKVAIAALDPLGMPVSALVVPGNHADDPLYVPQIQQVQQSFGPGGKTYVGDCKMAALGTRAYLANTQDYYLCPLSEKQFSRQQRHELIQRVRLGQQALQPVYRPKDNPHNEDERVAEGFAAEETLQADVAGQSIGWTERRWLVRSVVFAEGQEKQLERRLQQTQEELEHLTTRKQGKAVLSAEALQQAVLSILQKHRVQGLVTAVVQTTWQERTRRRYQGRAEEVVVEYEHRLEVCRQEEAIAEAKAELGWQVYGTNDLALSLTGVVWGYRGQYQIEKGWSRLKGRSLSLTPMYLADEGRMEGLVLLLSVALRVLTLVQWVARQQLQENAEPLRGLYPGQAGRKTSRPSAELLLRAFRGISLTVVAVAGQPSVLLTPLTALQEKLLTLWNFSAEIYQRLAALCLPELPLVSSER
jgi:transposase